MTPSPAEIRYVLDNAELHELPPGRYQAVHVGIDVTPSQVFLVYHVVKEAE